MIKKIAILFVLLCVIWAVFTCLQDRDYELNNGVFAQERARETEQKLKEIQKTLEKLQTIPDLVSPDSIYIVTQLKALYYQNVQMVELLTEIKELLHQSLGEEKEISELLRKSLEEKEE